MQPKLNPNMWFEVRKTATRLGGWSYQVLCVSEGSDKRRLASCRSLAGAMRWIKGRFPEATSVTYT